MFGILNVDKSELPEPIQVDEITYNDCDIFKFFSISQLMMPIDPEDITIEMLNKMFTLIDNVGEYYAFTDIKPENMVHDTNRVYIIDTDPIYLIQDDMLKTIYAEITGESDIPEESENMILTSIRRGIMYYVFCHYIMTYISNVEIINACLAKLKYWFEENDIIRGKLNLIIIALISPPNGHAMFRQINDMYIEQNESAISMKGSIPGVTSNITKYIVNANDKRKWEKLLNEICIEKGCQNMAEYGVRCDSFKKWCSIHRHTDSVESDKYYPESKRRK